MPLVDADRFLLYAALLLALGSALGRIARGRPWAQFGAAWSLVAAVPTGGLGAWAWWFTHRTPPPPARETIAPGVTWEREVHPGPVVVHVVTIALDAPGLRFFVSPGEPSPNGEARASTTGDFLEAHGLQVAVNGDFFGPFHSRALWDYYPHAGDPVEVSSLAISDGVRYSEPHPRGPSVYFTAAGRVLFDPPAVAPHDAVSGDLVFLRDGVALPSAAPYHLQRQPRTAVGVDAAGERLFLVVVDGRQPGYSVGIDVAGLARVAREHGVATALNLDGGGSSTLVVADADGRARLLNSPIDNGIPGRQRPVANHLGVFVAR
ncbi:MAG: phosphodiester glycosidase family protein [Myxococcota bacterium]